MKRGHNGNFGRPLIFNYIIVMARHAILTHSPLDVLVANQYPYINQSTISDIEEDIVEVGLLQHSLL